VPSDNAKLCFLVIQHRHPFAKVLGVAPRLEVPTDSEMLPEVPCQL
jgi:hypothetical protein